MLSCRIGKEMRMWFIGPIVFIWTGIFLTGYDVVHWVLYIPAVLTVVAFTTGRCPGMLLIRPLVKRLDKGA